VRLSNYWDSKPKKSPVVWRIKIYLFVGGLTLAILAVWYGIANWQFLKFKNFEIDGLSIFSKETLLNNIKPLLLKNYFLASLGFDNFVVWLGELDYRHPAIESIEVKRNFWERKIVFNVKEKERFGIWCQEDACQWFDQNGSFFDIAPFTEGYLVYKISGERPESETANVIKILRLLKENNITAKSIVFDERLRELEVVIPEGTKIKFNARADPEAIFLSAYEGVVKKLGWRAMKHLDLTVENRIYYQ